MKVTRMGYPNFVGNYQHLNDITDKILIFHSIADTVYLRLDSNKIRDKGDMRKIGLYFIDS